MEFHSGCVCSYYAVCASWALLISYNLFEPWVLDILRSGVFSFFVPESCVLCWGAYGLGGGSMGSDTLAGSIMCLGILTRKDIAGVVFTYTV